MNDVDVILGMMWMVKHQCVIRCVPRSVEIQHPSGKSVTLYASQSQQIALNSLRTKSNVHYKKSRFVRQIENVMVNIGFVIKRIL